MLMTIITKNNARTFVMKIVNEDNENGNDDDENDTRMTEMMMMMIYEE